MISHALCDAKSKKGEDAPAVKPQTAPDSVAAYAIFDGHGGRPFSHTCAHHTEAGIDHGAQYDVLAKLLAAGAGALPSDADVDDIFWKTDAEVGKLLATSESPNLGGCTAQILMALPVASGVQLLQAWVGDSTAVTVDMRRGGVVHSTFNHNPDQGDEAAPLLHMAAVNKACRKRQKKDRKKELKRQAKEAANAEAEGDCDDGVDAAAGDDDEGDDDDADGEGEENQRKEKENEAHFPCPSLELIREVLVEMEHADTSDAHVAQLHRAFERERFVQSHLPGSGKYRRNCFIYRRPREKDENMPMTVHTTADPFRGKHADMMMTRSLGDWKHVAWILPTPQIERRSMRPTDHWRVVLASDGLWDVVSHELCAQLTRQSPTCEEAATALLDAAKRVYLQERGLELPGDDTTVLVVDLNPSQRPFSEAGGGGGCCEVM